MFASSPPSSLSELSLEEELSESDPSSSASSAIDTGFSTGFLFARLPSLSSRVKCGKLKLPTLACLPGTSSSADGTGAGAPRILACSDAWSELDVPSKFVFPQSAVSKSEKEFCGWESKPDGENSVLFSLFSGVGGNPSPARSWPKGEAKAAAFCPLPNA